MSFPSYGCRRVASQEHGLSARAEACRARITQYDALGAAQDRAPLVADPVAVTAAEVLQSAARESPNPAEAAQAAAAQPPEACGGAAASPEAARNDLLRSPAALAAAVGALRTRALEAERRATAGAVAEVVDAARALERSVDAAAAWAFRQRGAAGTDDGGAVSAELHPESPWTAPFPQLSVEAVAAALAGASARKSDALLAPRSAINSTKMFIRSFLCRPLISGN